MELEQEIRINASRERVFAALNDAEILRQAIPGCEEIEALDDQQFSATVSAKVGPLKARFKGQVRLADIVEPESYTLSGEGRGGPAGHAKVQAQVALDDEGKTTLLRYQVKADIGGKLAQLGGQLVQNTAQKLAAEFFANFEALVSESDGDPQLSEAAQAAPEAAALDDPVEGRTYWWPASLIVGAALLAWWLLT